MIQSKTNYKVNYSETDKMGFVHHSNYVKYYENARWELFREMGFTYAQVEQLGVLMPVVGMEFSFLKPLYYDETFTVVTILKEISSVRIVFHYKIFNSNGECVNKAKVTTAFVQEKNLKPCKPPTELIKYFEESVLV